jgi:hypothetical protein
MERPAAETPYLLETYYVGSRDPHVLHFDSCSAALRHAGHVHRVHAGVSHTIASPIPHALRKAAQQATS